MSKQLWPRNISLHTLGYAALKYPELPEELPVPLMNQLGVLQQSPVHPVQVRIIPQVASQYLPSLLAYLYSDAPTINDPSSAQYYASSAFCLLNWLTSNPDVAVRVSKHPTLLHDVIDKLLAPKLAETMKACPRSSSETSFDSDLGSLLQFVSTMLLYSENPAEPPHPRIKDLVPILKLWKRKYAGFIGKVAERLADQIEKPSPALNQMMRGAMGSYLVCGYNACSKTQDLNSCSACKVQRYCSKEHQKGDWKNHKHICNKGLIEPGSDKPAQAIEPAASDKTLN